MENTTMEYTKNMDQFINEPYSIIDSLFQQKWNHSKDKENIDYSNIGEMELYSKLSENPDFIARIPIIKNIRMIGTIRPNTIVRYVGMIKDIFHNEFYNALYEERHVISGVTRPKLCKYMDNIPTSNDYEIIDSNLQKPLERVSVLCAPIPGLSSWAKEMIISTFHSDDDLYSTIEIRKETHLSKRLNENGQLFEGLKKQRSNSNRMEEVDSDIIQFSQNNDNYNITNDNDSNKDTSCLVRFYVDDSFKLNDMIEIIGIYTIDPILRSLDMEPSLNMFEEFETNSTLSSLPSSLYPRIHCLTYRKLHPSYPMILQETISSYPTLWRQRILEYLTKALFQDELLAKYILLTILSRIYTRNGNGSDISTFNHDNDSQIIGNFILKMEIPELYRHHHDSIASYDTSYIIHRITDCLSNLVPRLTTILADMESLNHLNLRPKRDFDQNIMTSSPLQVVEGTILCIDETKLHSMSLLTSSSLAITTNHSALIESGIDSLYALQQVISNQKLPIDYGCYELSLLTNSPVILFTTDKNESVVCKDMIMMDSLGAGSNIVLIRWKPMEHEIIQNRIENNADNQLMEVNQDLRQYIAMIRSMDVTMTEEVIKQAEHDFLVSRQRLSSQPSDQRMELKPMITANDFHRWLTLSRLIAISYGSSIITLSHWNEMLSMERDREARAFESLGQNQNMMIPTSGSNRNNPNNHNHHNNQQYSMDIDRANTPISVLSQRNHALSPTSVTLDQNIPSRF